MWQTLHYATQGRGHLKHDVPCQDKTYSCTQDGVTVVALADGAGSAPLSHLGADVVVQTACRYLVDMFDTLVCEPDGRQVKVNLLTALQRAIRAESEALACSTSALASTFLMVAIKDNQFIMAHIGDGLIGYVKEGELKIASAPTNGEYANSTVFVTSSQALTSMQLFKGTLTGISGFVLMSDGTAESFYHKKEHRLASIVTKLLHFNAILNPSVLFESIKTSFDSTVVLNTLDDCSIALLSTPDESFPDFTSFTPREKCEFLSIPLQTKAYTKKIQRVESILQFLETPKTLKQIARQLHIRERHVFKYVDRLHRMGLIVEREGTYRVFC